MLLPASLVHRIRRSRLHEVLVHEMRHVVRRDPWVGLLQRLVAIAYWPHPLIHLMNRRLARCREEVCDNCVLSDVRPADYADTLLHLAVYHQESLSAAGLIGLFVLRWKLEDRIRQLLDRRCDQRVHLTSRSRWGVLVSACVFLAAALTLQIGPRAQAEKEQLPAAH